MCITRGLVHASEARSIHLPADVLVCRIHQQVVAHARLIQVQQQQLLWYR